MTWHKDITPAKGIHGIVAYIYNNETDRLAASGFTSVDLFRVAYQIDNQTFWILKSIAPKWELLGSATGLSQNLAASNTTDGYNISFTNGSKIIVGNYTLSIAGNISLDGYAIDGYHLSSQFQSITNNFSSLNNRNIIAGNGLTGGGVLSSDITLNVTAANSSIVVNPDSIQVGTITDSNHGSLSGDGLHAIATQLSNGFMSYNDKIKLDNISLVFDGYVVKPASSTDNAIVRFDGTTGKYIQNSVVTIGDTGQVSGVQYLDFTPQSTVSHLEGRVYFDTEDHTLNVMTDVTGTVLQVGQENLIRVSNRTGALITNGSVVYVDGAQGNRPTIALASSTTIADINSIVIGLTTDDIPNNSIGYVTTYGIVRELNTLSLSEGARIYLSSTPGSFTTVMPTGTERVVPLGIVTRAHPTFGEVFVRLRPIYKLAELWDVNDGYQYDGYYLRGNGTYWTSSSFTSDVNNIPSIINATAHLTNTNNPHNTSIANIGSGTLSQLNSAISDADVVPNTITITAGNGLTGGGNLSTNRTIDIVAADSTITVNADSIQVGVITDTNHGSRSGGALHSTATTSTAGFMSASDKTKLDNFFIWSVFSDGTNTSSPASSSDTFRFRSANNAITTTVTNNDVTYGDNLLLTFNPGNVTHSSLGSLTSSDDHTQYVHNTTARTISAIHTFSPGSATAPFILSANAQGQLITGLNSDKLDGQDGSYYLTATNINSGTLPSSVFNDTSHGSRSGGTLHSTVTNSLAGFMPAVGASGTIPQSNGTDITYVSELTNPQKVTVSKSGTAIGSRSNINFIEGSNVTITTTDNSGSGRVDVTIASSGGTANAYSNITDGTTTATASGADTIRFRSANNILTTTVGSNDVTYGDNLLLTVNQGNIDHGSIGGLTDDDHTQYLLTNGTRALTGSLSFGGFNITNLGTIDGYNLYTQFQSITDSLNTKTPLTRTVTAGNGLTGGGALSSDITLNVVAADSSITVNADNISVGVISDTQHGNRGGGSLHSPVSNTSAGFVPAVGLDGYQLFSNGTSSVWKPLKRTYCIEYSLIEGVTNTSVYFYSWRTTSSTTALRSGDDAGMDYGGQCSPIQVPFNATITKATLALRGAGVASGTVTYPVIYTANLVNVLFTSSSLVSSLNWGISNAYTVQSWSPANTQYKGVITPNIQVSEGQLLGLKFINGSGDSAVAQMLNAVVTLVLEER